LDLQGGTQILLAAKQTDGQAVSGEQLEQAVAIIRQRVNASGVSEAEISTQGSQNISVSIPGKADAATLQRIEASAQLQFRAVLHYGPATYETPSSGTAEGEDGSDGAAEGEDGSDGAADSSETTGTETDSAENGSADADAASDGSTATDSSSEDSATQD